MHEKFERLVEAAIPGSSKKTLDRRVPTRWNSDFTCLQAHVHFAEAVRNLTNDAKLGAFALTESQWALAKQLVNVLEVHTHCLPPC